MYIAIDLETTGLNWDRDDIIEIGAIVFDENGNIISEFQSFVKTTTEIPEIITQITGIKDTDLANAPKINDLKPQIEKLLENNIIIGHNIEFDLSFLKKAHIKIPQEKIDTLFLASALLPRERSHSLEALCKSLSLQNESSHNALEDAKSAMKLFLFLKEKFQNLNKDLLCELEKLSKKTKLLPDSFFENQSKNSDTKHLETPKKTIRTRKLRSPENSLNEINTDYLSLAKSLLQDKKRVLSLPGHLCEQLNTFTPIKILDGFDNYVDSQRLSAFINKNEFKEYEIKALFKILIWTYIFPEKSLRGIKLFNEEKKIIYKINRTEKTVSIKIKSEESIVLTHECLIQNPDISEKIDLVDLSYFKKSYERETNHYINLETLISPLENLKETNGEKEILDLINKSIILFGLIGIYFEKNKSDFDNQIKLPNSFIGKKDLKKIKDSVNNLILSSKNLVKIKSDKTIFELSKWKKNLQTLSLAFKDEPEKRYHCFLIQQKEGQIAISLQDKEMQKNLKTFFNEIKDLRIFELSLDLNDDATFAKMFYAIPEKLKYAKNEDVEKRKIQIMPSQTQEIESKIQSILNDSNTLIVVNSKIQLKRLTISLSKRIKDKLIISETLGSIGKINEQLNNNDIPVILLVSPSYIEKIENPEKFKSLIILSIPFSKPDKIYPDFEKQTLPSTALKLKKLIKMTKDATNIFIFDKRITNANYGTKLQKYLQKDFELIEE